MAATRSKAKAAEAEMPRETKPRSGAAGKLIFMGFILLVLAGGALVVLARYQIITVPYLSDLPFIKQETVPAESTPELTELQKATQENDGLQETIKDQQVEIEALNEDLDKAETGKSERRQETGGI